MQNYLQQADTYFGKDCTRGENELDSLRFIAPEISRREPDLYQTKWWDYRVMHHVEATRLWAHYYSQALKQYCAATYDIAKVESLKTYEGRDVLQTRDAIAVVNARQAMDSIGCRYQWAMQWMINRFVSHGWPALPRPNQLYGEDFVLDLRDAWAIELAASIQKPANPVFRAQGRAGLRGEYGKWAVQQARKRAASPDLVWMPLSTLARDGLIDRGMVEQEFGSRIASLSFPAK